MRMVSVAAMALLLLSSCGKPKEGLGLHPRIQIKLSSVAAAKNTHWPKMSSPLLASASQLSDLNCFAINVRGTDQEAGSACGGISPGFSDGSYSGISTAFHPVVPTDTELVFEAYGAQVSGDCPSFSDAVAGLVASGVTFFRIGSVTTQALDSITIPVAFNSSLEFNCVP